MSHEIRTPLTAILGFSTILADELPAEHRLFAQLIDRSGRRLLETLNSVLDLAQLESGRFHFEPTAVDLVERAREVAELFQPAAREKQLWLDVHAAQPEVVALCDPALVDRILNNLVGNAIKFTGSGGVSLEVGEEAGRAVLRVRDSGIGIGPEFIPHVFDEFRQESSGLARSFEGSGLGLTITRRLVELMNGAVEIDSEPGQGTVVTVRLPRSDHAPVTPAPPGLDAPGPACAPGRVLVVEDSTETQRLLLEMLGPPLRVDVAATVGEALALVARERYESILLDINLGEERTGRDVLEAIRTDGPNRDTPVVALTAYALPGDRERFLAAGFDAYLGKPFTRARLFETLEAVR